MCYIETKNLDGETNLENKQADTRIKDKYIKGENNFGNECVIVHYESPNKMIYRFDGKIEPPFGDSFLLNYSNVVLRGCCLKNTEYVIGMAVYTGYVSYNNMLTLKMIIFDLRHQSKIMYNLYAAGAKKSMLE